MNSTQTKNTNLYEILGVPSTCSPDTLRKQYHRLLLEYHPDKCFDVEKLERYYSIKNAFKILSDDTLRQNYEQEQKRQTLIMMPLLHVHIDDMDEFVDNDSRNISYSYDCRCGTLLTVENDKLQELEINGTIIIECENCSMTIEIRK